jgi:hypothetical protein
MRENGNVDAHLWINEDFADWLRLVNLQKYIVNLSQSGLHGALLVDNVFNLDFMLNILEVKTDDVHENKKILDDEIKLLKKFKR